MASNHQRCGLDGRMHSKIGVTARSPGVDPGIVPDIASIAPALATLYGIDVGLAADLVVTVIARRAYQR